jgi:predicted nucleic acid-binding protein
MPRLAYLDTSALAKLVMTERESGPVEQTMLEYSGLVSSWLASAELRRAGGRGRRSGAAAKIDEALAAVVLVEVTPALLETAGQLEPSELRTLDAIHLATALSLGDPALDVITYDDRLAAAARQHGLRVLSPGR